MEVWDGMERRYKTGRNPHLTSPGVKINFSKWKKRPEDVFKLFKTRRC